MTNTLQDTDELTSTTLTQLDELSEQKLPLSQHNKAQQTPRVLGDNKKPENFVNIIYEQFANTFGNQNPTQMFSLCWPGTVLDPQALGVEKDASEIPLKQLIRTSQVMDTYVPPAPITQPDGTRTSDRYKMAISQLAPKVNPELAKLQEIVREKINTQIEIEIDNEKQTMSMSDAFYRLYSSWISKKREWSEQINNKRNELAQKYSGDPQKQYDEFLAWHTTVSESYISSITLAYTNLIAQFPLSQWEDSIAILDTYSDGGLGDAKTIMRNAVVSVPPEEGFTYLPIQSIPAAWPNQIKPTTSFIDYLSDPELQKSVFETAMNQLNAQIAAWKAIIPQIDDKDVQQKTKALSEANQNYRNAWKKLRDTYTENTVTAVQILMDILASNDESLDDANDDQKADRTKKVNELSKSLTEQNEKESSSVDYEEIKEIATKVGDMQNNLNDSQSGAIDCGIQLANAANDYLETKGKSSNMGWLKSYIDQLTTCCEKAKAQLANFSSASNRYNQYLNAAGNTEDANQSDKFGSNAFASNISDSEAKNWTEMKIVIDKESMNSSSDLTTSFSQRDWGVNFFLGSASGSNTVSGSEFAESFMSNKTKIELGFLAQKVVIQRSWLKAGIFTNTASMYRTMKAPLSPQTKDSFDAADACNPKNAQKIKNLISDYQFPSYPVAFIIVKDLCVKINVETAETNRAREQWNKTKTQGGGFFCFSISDTTAEVTDNESTNSYAMAGQLILRSPTPQIIGYYSQLLPPDNSTILTTGTVQELMESMTFLENLKSIHSSDAIPEFPIMPSY
ncbi:hypothetical protein [Vibrio salilacus]|uniref:hypothetical protein n=1 Tax=Vibrio salilacus TaxID=1323749 RepID=UPI000C2A9C41|nr:hypothetical protein [Vibrio salilacus]